MPNEREYQGPIRAEILRLMQGCQDEDKLFILELLRTEVQFDLFCAKLRRAADVSATEAVRLLRAFSGATGERI